MLLDGIWPAPVPPSPPLLLKSSLDLVARAAGPPPSGSHGAEGGGGLEARAARPGGVEEWEVIDDAVFYEPVD